MADPTFVMSMHVVGVNSAQIRIMSEVNGLITRGAAGITSAARDVHAQARANMSAHTHGSNAHKHTRDSIEIHGISRAGAKVLMGKRITSWVSASVGIAHTSWPQFAVGSTFERGWHSRVGKQPPTPPLARWALQRGFAHDEKEAKRIGFLVARKIFRKGYSFGEDHWLSDAYNGPAAVATVERYLASSWASQERGPGGRFL